MCIVAFGDFAEIIDYLRANYAYWKEEQSKREEIILERKLRKSMSTACGESDSGSGKLTSVAVMSGKSQRSFSNPPATTPDDRKKLIQVLKGNAKLNSSLSSSVVHSTSSSSTSYPPPSHPPPPPPTSTNYTARQWSNCKWCNKYLTNLCTILYKRTWFMFVTKNSTTHT